MVRVCPGVVVEWLFVRVVWSSWRGGEADAAGSVEMFVGVGISLDVVIVGGGSGVSPSSWPRKVCGHGGRGAGVVGVAFPWGASIGAQSSASRNIGGNVEASSHGCGSVCGRRWHHRCGNGVVVLRYLIFSLMGHRVHVCVVGVVGVAHVSSVVFAVGVMETEATVGFVKLHALVDMDRCVHRRCWRREYPVVAVVCACQVANLTCCFRRLSRIHARSSCRFCLCLAGAPFTSDRHAQAHS